MSLFERTIKEYGKELQIEVLIEECAELIQALQKYKRTILGTPNANVTVTDIISEAIDVEIMIDQLKIIFPNKEVWRKIRNKKLARLESRLSRKTE